MTYLQSKSPVTRPNIMFLFDFALMRHLNYKCYGPTGIVVGAGRGRDPKGKYEKLSRLGEWA